MRGVSSSGSREDAVAVRSEQLNEPFCYTEQREFLD
jgi:hypothetical protein